MADECIFCAIVGGKIPSFKVFENDNFVAFLDINPANPGHVVLVTKKHIRSLMEMDNNLYAEMFVIARGLSLAVLESGAEGINFLLQMGETAGQRVPHTYLHIVPRKKDDKIPLFWNPQKMTNEQLSEMQKKISGLIGGKKEEPKKEEPKIETPKEEKKKEVYKLRPRTGGR